MNAEPLEFDARIHLTQLQKDIEEVNKRIDGMGQKVNQKTSSIDAGFQKLGGTIAKAFAVGAIVATGKHLIDVAGESYKAEAKVAQAVKQTGMAAGFTAKELAKMAKEFQNVTTFEDDQIMNGVTAQLLTFTNVTGENFKRAQEAAMDLATLLDGDLKGSAIQLGKALSDPVNGLTALRRSGVMFTEAQRAQIEGLVKSNKLFEAQSLVLDEINRQYGGQARAMADLPVGKLEQMKNAWGDIKEEMGKLILESELFNKVTQETQKSLAIMGSTQLSFWEKINPFESQEKTYQKDIQRQKEFEEKQKTLGELSKGQTDEGESSMPKEQLKPETVREQTKRLRDEIAAAEKDLRNLRKGDAIANTGIIETKQAEVDAMKAQLETLTGASKKAADDAVKIEKERQEALKDLSQQEIEIRRQNEASKIAIMAEGTEKQMAEADLAYNNEIDAILERRKAMEKSLEESGLKGGTDEYSARQDAINKEIGEAEVLAAQKLASEKVRIEKEAADAIEEIRRGISGTFLSDQQREIQDINQRYAEYEKELAKNPNTTADDRAQLKAAQNKELLDLDLKYGLQRLDFEEQIERQIADIRTRGIELASVVERRKLEIEKQYIQQRLNMLKASNDPKNANQIKTLETALKGVNAGIKATVKQTRMEVFDLLVDFVDVIGQGDERIGALVNTAKGIGQIMAGDVRGLFSVFQSIIQFSEAQKKREEERQQAQLEGLQNYLSGLEQAYAIIEKAIDRAFGNEKLAQYSRATQSLGRNLEYLIEEINALAKSNLKLPTKSEIIGYRSGSSTSGVEGGGRGESPIYGYGVNALMEIIKQNEKTIEYLSQKYAQSGNKEVKELLGEYAEYVDKLYSLRDSYFEMLTGTTASSITDAIVEGFRNGYDSAADFADEFEKMMQQAVVNAMKIKVLEEPLKEWYEKFAEYSENGEGLTADEIEELRKKYDTIIENAMRKWEDLKNISGVDFTADEQRDAIKGSFQNLTEETGGLLLGQFFAFREYQTKTYMTGVEQLTVLNQSMTHLAQIAENTKHNSKLVDIDSKLGEMNKLLRDI